MTFIFGETVELSPDKIYASASDDTQYNNYSITYNSGGKLVHENIHLSVIETFQLRRNNGFMNFRKLNGYVTYRSAFVRGTVFLLVLIALGVYIPVSRISGFGSAKQE